MKIKIFVTGGTFDKEYNELTGALFFRDTHIQEILKRGRNKLAIDVQTLMLIDSLDMKDEDRAIVVDHCKKTVENKILITHGTDTMVETARAIAKGGIKNKTIVFTGAMVPYTFGSSDGLFNLGCALAFVQTLPAGIYIAMNGKYFLWDNVRKNKKVGEFEEIK